MLYVVVLLVTFLVCFLFIMSVRSADSKSSMKELLSDTPTLVKDVAISSGVAVASVGIAYVIKRMFSDCSSSVCDEQFQEAPFPVGEQVAAVKPPKPEGVMTTPFKEDF